jgi:hypothetical protein
MDPVTAFQTASAVLSVVDFGLRVLSDGYEIYKSGTQRTARNDALAQVSQELSGLSERVQQRLVQVSSAGTQATNGGSSDTLLREIARRCDTASKRLERAIDDLRRSSKSSRKTTAAAKSLIVALRGIWNQNELDELKAELSDIRSQLTLAVIISMWLVIPVFANTGRCQSTQACT